MFPYLDFSDARSLLLESGAGQQVYCLADHAGIPGLVQQLVRSESEWSSLFSGTKEEGALAVSPILFSVCACTTSAAGRRLLDWVSKHGTYGSSLLLLATPLAMNELSLRLARRLEARISDDMDVLLRYFDPRVFEQLMFVLSDEQKIVLLSPADSWGIVDRQGKLKIVRSKLFPVDSLEGPMLLSADQEYALLDASEPDQVTEQLSKNMSGYFSRIPLLSRYDFVVKNLRDAQSFGIEVTHEKSLFCALALIYGDEFSQMEPWETALERVRAGSESFSDAVAAAESARQLEI